MFVSKTMNSYMKYLVESTEDEDIDPSLDDLPDIDDDLLAKDAKSENSFKLREFDNNIASIKAEIKALNDAIANTEPDSPEETALLDKEDKLRDEIKRIEQEKVQYGRDSKNVQKNKNANSEDRQASILQSNLRKDKLTKEQENALVSEYLRLIKSEGLSAKDEKKVELIKKVLIFSEATSLLGVTNRIGKYYQTRGTNVPNTTVLSLIINAYFNRETGLIRQFQPKLQNKLSTDINTKFKNDHYIKKDIGNEYGAINLSDASKGEASRIKSSMIELDKPMGDDDGQGGHEHLGDDVEKESRMEGEGSTEDGVDEEMEALNAARTNFINQFLSDWAVGDKELLSWYGKFAFLNDAVRKTSNAQQRAEVTQRISTMSVEEKAKRFPRLSIESFSPSIRREIKDLLPDYPGLIRSGAVDFANNPEAFEEIQAYVVKNINTQGRSRANKVIMDNYIHLFNKKEQLLIESYITNVDVDVDSVTINKFNEKIINCSKDLTTVDKFMKSLYKRIKK